MITAELKYDLEELSQAMRQYGELSRKTEDEVITKQATKLAWNISRGLRKLSPAKGSVTAERLAAMRRGIGTKVRPAVMLDVAASVQAQSSIATGKTWLGQKKGKRFVAFSTEVLLKSGKRGNLQALAVERELRVREMARGFAGYSAPRPQDRSGETTSDVERAIESRYGFTLSQFNIVLDAERKYAQLRWLGAHSGLYQSPVEGLSKPKQMAVVDEAVRDTTEDIMEYVERKQREDIAKVFNW